MRKVQRLIYASTLVVGSAAFSTTPAANVAPSRASSLSAQNDRDNESRICNNSDAFSALTTRTLASAAVSLAILASPLHGSPLIGGVALADELGVETEAPTLFTGETTMICTKRGPLGACLESVRRTVQNDNDKAQKYFKDPSPEVKRRQERMLQSADDSEGNALIAKLRQQSLDNKERNDDIVRARTLLNGQGANFGPFNGQVVILNTDGKTFTMLQNPQAMRLKKAGYIEDRKFVIQPSQDVIDEALEGKNELGDAVKGFFGFGGGGEEEVVEVQVEVKADESAKEVVNSVVTEDSLAVESSASTEESAVAGDEKVEKVEKVESVILVTSDSS